MLIAKDRSSGAELLRLETDDYTFWLACAMVLKRLARTDMGRYAGDYQKARWWVEGSFLKSFDFGGAVMALSALFSLPLASIALVLRILLLGDVPRKAKQNAVDTIFHAYDLSQRVIKKAVRGVVVGFAETCHKAARLYQVGPVLRNPHFFKTGPLELLRSLIYRSARQVPEVQKELLDDFIKHGVEQALAACFPCGVEFSVP